MLLMIEEAVRGGITLVITKFSEANYKCMQNYDQNKDSSFLQYLDFNSLYAGAMCQKLPVKNFEWCKDLRYINQKFIKDYDEDSSEKGYILGADVEYSKNCKMNTVIYHFYPKRLKLINRRNLHVIFMIKQDMWSTLNYYDKLWIIV